jgi:Flp pilus assembly protein TadG
MVELALITPVVVILLIGIIQFGILYNRQIALQSAAREGARELALADTAAKVTAAQTTAITASGFSSTQVSTTVNSNCIGASGNAPQARMTLSMPSSLDIPFLFSRSITLTASAQMRCGL